MKVTREIIKENYKIIEYYFYSNLTNEKVNCYILKKKIKNGVFREIKRGNLGNRTLEEQLEFELQKEKE